MPMQPTASRTRSLLFWHILAVRLRRLMGKPFGRSDHYACLHLFICRRLLLNELFLL